MRETRFRYFISCTTVLSSLLGELSTINIPRDLLEGKVRRNQAIIQVDTWMSYLRGRGVACGMPHSILSKRYGEYQLLPINPPASFDSDSDVTACGLADSDRNSCQSN